MSTHTLTCENSDVTMARSTKQMRALEKLIEMNSVFLDGPTLGDHPKSDPAVISIEWHDLSESMEK